MAEPTTTRNFRENLKYFFDLATKNPIAINRGSERYVLMSENEFVKMKEEVMNLQKSLISTMQTLHSGGGTGYTNVKSHYDEILDSALSDEEKDIAVKKRKRAAG